MKMVNCVWNVESQYYICISTIATLGPIYEGNHEFGKSLTWLFIKLINSLVCLIFQDLHRPYRLFGGEPVKLLKRFDWPLENEVTSSIINCYEWQNILIDISLKCFSKKRKRYLSQLQLRLVENLKYEINP